MVGVAGVGSGNDCLVVRKGDDIKDWKSLQGKNIGVGAGSISWLKFAASVQENGVEYGKLKIINIMGGGTNYLKALQGKEIDMAVVWQPFCAQGIVDGYAQYPTIDHNRSKTVGGLISVLAVNRGFMEKNRDAVQRLVVAYVDVLKFAQANPQRWAKIYAEKAGLPEPVAAESIRITQAGRHAAAGVDQAPLQVPLRQRRHRPRRLRRDRRSTTPTTSWPGDGQDAGSSSGLNQ